MYSMLFLLRYVLCHRSVLLKLYPFVYSRVITRFLARGTCPSSHALLKQSFSARWPRKRSARQEVLVCSQLKICTYQQIKRKMSNTCCLCSCLRVYS